jgi:nicotinate-nucleotide adenylyltransferase
MRIGIFGGTFDPVHVGHLILAEQCREQGRLDQVRFVPAFRPPHKPDVRVTPFLHRVEMLALATAGHPAFRVDQLEKDRDGPSYTVDTLDELHRRHPGHDFLLLIGSDTLADLAKWRAPERIVAQAGLLIVTRPGSTVLSADDLCRSMNLPQKSNIQMQLVQTPLIDISSHDLRRRAAAGRSLRYFVPRAVECYIHDKRLYQGDGVGP